MPQGENALVRWVPGTQPRVHFSIGGTILAIHIRLGRAAGGEMVPRTPVSSQTPVCIKDLVVEQPPPSLPTTELRGVQGGNEGQRSPVSHTREAGRTECPSVTCPPAVPPSLHCLPTLLGSWQVALLGPPWKPLASPFSGVPLRAWGAPPSAEVWVCLSFPPQVGPGSDVWVYSPKTPTPRPIDRRAALLGCRLFYPWRSL